MGAFQELAAISDQRIGRYFSYVGLGPTTLNGTAEFDGSELGLTWSTNTGDWNDDNYAEWLELNPSTGALTVTESGIYQQICLAMFVEVAPATPSNPGLAAPYQSRSDLAALNVTPSYTLHATDVASSLTSNLAKIQSPPFIGFVPADTTFTPGLAVHNIDLSLYVFVNTLEKVL